MRTEQKIFELLKAVKVLKDLPPMKLKQNERLLGDIQSVINSNFFSSLVSDIRKDYIAEKDAAFRLEEKSLLQSEDLTFLSLHAKFKTQVYEKNFKRSPARYTNLVSQTEALNFRKRRPKVLNLSDVKSKDYEDAFNSIFANKSIQIGTDRDPTFVQSYIDYSPYINNYQYYLSIPTLSQTIDKGIQIATRELPEIITDDDELTEELYKYINRTRFNEKVQKMLLNSHLSPRGAVLVPINENGKVRFNVFNDTQFTYAVSPQYNHIDFRDGGYGVSTIYVLGYNLQNGVTCHFLCPGFEPIYGVGKNRLYQLKGAAEAINIYLYTIKVLCIRAQVLVQKWGGEGQNDTMLQKMQQLTDDINTGLSLSSALQMPADAELNILNNNINEGFAKVQPIIKEFQAMLAGIMPDYFYGSDTAYNANSFNTRVTHQNIRSDIQEPQIAPQYRFMINTLLANDTRFKKWQDKEDDFEIKFPSLYEATEEERVNIDTKKIDNLIKMADYPELVDVFKKEGLLPEEYEVGNGKGDLDDEQDPDKNKT